MPVGFLLFRFSALSAFFSPARQLKKHRLWPGRPGRPAPASGRQGAPARLAGAAPKRALPFWAPQPRMKLRSSSRRRAVAISSSRMSSIPFWRIRFSSPRMARE